MAGGRIRGITIELGGDTSKFVDAIKKADKSINETQKKLKDVNKLLKLDPGNTELLRQKQEALAKAVEQTGEKSKALKAALKEMEAAGITDKTRAQYDALQRELVETEQSFKSLKKEANGFGSVFAQQISVAGEKVKEFGGKVTNVGKGMSATVTAPLVGFFTVAASGASDLEENLNKVDVAFGSDAKAVKDWSETATTQFGLSRNAALEAASLFGDMGTAMGLTTGDAAEMSMNLAGLAGDLSSFKNIDIETAMNALKGVFTGETESLKGLGVIMNQTNLKEFAADMGLVYDEMSQAELVNLRYNYVLEATKNAQGDYARTSDGTANSIRTLQATLSNLTAELGSALLPIITPIIQKVTEWAKRFTGLDEGTRKTIVTIGLVVAAIGPLLVVIGNLVSIIGTIMTMAPAISAAFAALSGPIGLAVAAIAGLIAIGVALGQHWDEVVEWTKNLGRSISKAFDDILKSIKTAVNNAWTAVRTAFQNIVNAITNAVNNARNTVSNVFNAIKNTISNVLNAALGVVQSVVNRIKSAFNFSLSIPSIATGALDVAKGAVDWVVSAIKGAFNFSLSLPSVATGVFSSVTSTVQGIVDKVKGAMNFSWSLPVLKVPRVTVDGGAAPWGIGGKGRLPSFNVTWHKNAYDNPMLFTRPTVLATPNGFHGFGDGNGAELVIGTNKLREIIGATGNNINVNVYAAPGMNETALANAVALKLDRWLGERV